MTHDEARRRLERTTAFRFEGGQVVVRDPRWLRAVEVVRRTDAAAEVWRASAPLARVRAA